MRYLAERQPHLFEHPRGVVRWELGSHVPHARPASMTEQPATAASG